MAKGESVGGLFLRLRLSYDELNQDFVNVEETISANVQRLNRESKLIRLKTEIDLTSVTSAADKLKIQRQALTQQIEIQIQKVRLYAASEKEAAQANGQASKQAQNATIALKQQELALAKLQHQLKEVTAQQQELAKSSASNSGGLLGSYKGIKGDVAGNIGRLTSAFQGLKDASGSADGAITKTLEIIDAIPSPVGKAVAALASIPLVVKGIENSLLDMAKPAMSSGDALYAMSRGMQMSLADTAKLATICKVTGIELSEVAATTRRVATALTKTDEKTTLMKRTLQQYGVELKNSNGELKNTLDMSIALAEGLKKAQAEGRGKEFIASVFGRFYSGDYITYLEDLAGNIALAKKIVKNGLADPALAHEVQGNMNALNTQIEQLSGAFSYALLPVANKIIPRTMEQFGELTKIIAENKDGIQAFGTALAEVVGTVGSVAMTATNNIVRLVGALGNLVSNKAKKDSVIDKYVNDEKIKSLEDLVNAELRRNYTYTDRISIESNPALYQQTLNHYQPMFKALEEAREKIKKEIQDLNEILNTPVSVADISTISLERQATHFVDKWKAAREELKATAALSDELFKATHDDYENRKFDLLRWRQDLLNEETTTAQQRELIEQIYAAKSVQIEQERADAIKTIEDEFAESRNALRKTDLENQLDAIDKAKDAWIDKGVTEEEATALAEEQKADVIKKFNEEAVAKLGSIWQTSLEQRLAQIEREKQAWIQKGVDEVKSTQWAEQAKADAQRNAAMSVLKSQIDEYRAFREGGYAGLMNHRLDELYKSGIRPEDLQMTPQQLAAFQKAQDTVERNLLPNFATDYDRAENNRLLNNMIVEKQRLQREELEKIAAGITIDGVQMELTPEITADFGIASEEVLSKMYDPVNHTAEEFQQLIPGLEDARQTLSGFSAVEQPTPTDIPAPETPATPELDTSGLTQPVADITEKFVALSPALDDLSGKITDLGTIISEAIENIPQVEPPAVEAPDLSVDTSQIFSALEELVSPMNEVNSQFGAMSNRLTEVTSGLSELVGALNNLQLSNQNQVESRQANIPPPNITVTVQIEEAHAWDSKHIQELADKVADKITPELTRAIGGDSNGY